jgi:hypothetical protein
MAANEFSRVQAKIIGKQLPVGASVSKLRRDVFRGSGSVETTYDALYVDTLADGNEFSQIQAKITLVKLVIVRVFRKGPVDKLYKPSLMW